MNILKRIFIAAFLGLVFAVTASAEQGYRYIHENVRTVPYPQEGMPLYINPSALFVPESMKTAENIQFALSCDENFSEENTLLSAVSPWCMFNPHKELKPGVWYWKFRNVSASGECSEWSDVYSFKMTDDVPVFVTPGFDKFISHIPTGNNRIYCFLTDGIEKSKKNIHKHPEFYDMVSQARQGIAANYTYDTNPYAKVGEMAELSVKLRTAYDLLGRSAYAEKMASYVRRLLAVEFDKNRLANDFFAGDLAFLLSNVYEACHSIFTEEEKAEIQNIVTEVFKYYIPLMYGHEENHVFNNHFWQFPVRKFMQAALVFYDKEPLAKQVMEYLYEVWTCKAPSAGLNRDGNWHNGTSYFSANAVTLYYMASLFSHLTGVDFMSHPWYKNSGVGMVYSWPPESLSAGFGDGHEKLNHQPLRIRSAFADFLARETGDPYAAWYSSINQLYKNDYELRIYRMACGKMRPACEALPQDAPKSVWFKDSGEMVYMDSLVDYKHGIYLSFRSIPFGSGSHTHSNQNSFNLHYNGVPVYRSVGHYMSFNDAHNMMSYRHTRAHNTILVDGMGQPFTTKAYGEITRMLSGENITYVLGDASNAYCGVSEYPMWENNFKKAGIAQSPENGFGNTSLKKFLRHVMVLDKNIVVVYDELEAGKKVTWDWLLHSPVRFNIDGNTLVTRNEEGRFTATARIISKQPFACTQTDGYIENPDKNNAVRGEMFVTPWNMKASFQPSKANRILTVITITPDGEKKHEITLNDGSGSVEINGWSISAELDTRKPAGIVITGKDKKSKFCYGSKKLEDYGRKVKGSSVLYDYHNGEWKYMEMTDRKLKPVIVK